MNYLIVLAYPPNGTLSQLFSASSSHDALYSKNLGSLKNSIGEVIGNKGRDCFK